MKDKQLLEEADDELLAKYRETLRQWNVAFLREGVDGPTEKKYDAELKQICRELTAAGREKK